MEEYMDRDELKKRMKNFRKMLDTRFEKCRDEVCLEIMEILEGLSQVNAHVFSQSDYDRGLILDENGEMSAKDSHGEAVVHMTESITNTYFILSQALDGLADVYEGVLDLMKNGEL